MIIDLVLSILVGFLTFIVGLIPSINFNFDIAGYGETLAEYVGYIDTFIPINVLIFCITASIVVDNFGFIVKILTFLWSKIPIIGG